MTPSDKKRTWLLTAVTAFYLCCFWMTGEILTIIPIENPGQLWWILRALWISGAVVGALMCFSCWTKKRWVAFAVNGALLLGTSFHTSEYHLMYQAGNVSVGDSYASVAARFASQHTIVATPQESIYLMAQGADESGTNKVEVLFNRKGVSEVKVISDLF